MEKVIDGKDVNKFSILPSLDHKVYLTCTLAALPRIVHVHVHVHDSTKTMLHFIMLTFNKHSLGIFTIFMI
jgi:hypothetical protein